MRKNSSPPALPDYELIGHHVARFLRPSKVGSRFLEVAGEWSGEQLSSDVSFRCDGLNAAYVAFCMHPDQQAAATQAAVFLTGAYSLQATWRLAVQLTRDAAQYYPHELVGVAERPLCSLTLFSYSLLFAYGCRLTCSPEGQLNFVLLKKSERRRILQILFRRRAEFARIPAVERLRALRNLVWSHPRLDADEPHGTELIFALAQKASAKDFFASGFLEDSPLFFEFDEEFRWKRRCPLRACALIWRCTGVVPPISLVAEADWSDVLMALGPSATVEFGEALGHVVPPRLVQAAKAHPEADSEYSDWMLQEISSLFSTPHERVTEDFIVLGVVAGLGRLLESERWEAALFNCISEAAETQLPSDDPKRYAQDRIHQEFADVIASSGGRLEVWRDLFVKLGVLANITSHDADWRRASSQARDEQQPVRTIEEVIASSTRISRPEAARFARLAESNSPALSGFMKLLVLGREQSHAVAMARHVGENILREATRASMTVLAIASCLVSPWGRGGNARNLRRISTVDPDGYWRAHRELFAAGDPGDLASILRKAVCPERDVWYLVVEGRLVLISRAKIEDTILSGKSCLPPGKSTVLHLSGPGKGMKPTIIKTAFATEVKTSQDGMVKSFTGSGLVRLPGRLRPLLANEVTLIKRHYPHLCEQSEAELALRSKTVRDLVKRVVDSAKLFPAYW